jgi:DNA-binding CsgD family transcriptional regulator
MQRSAVKAGGLSEGFLLVNSALNPILVNRVAAEILSYPEAPEAHKDLDQFLAGKISSALFLRTSGAPTVVAKFRSGKRLYHCRAYRVNPLANLNSQASLAVLLERGSRPSSSLVEVSEKFRLTSREKEVVRYLVSGLTTKEIATRLEISPHTVKAFLRLIMVKMEVSTRSGIVGKAFLPVKANP